MDLDACHTHLLDTLVGLNMSRFVPLIAQCSFIFMRKYSNVQGNHFSITCIIELNDKQEIVSSVNESALDAAIRAIVDKAKRHLARVLRSRRVVGAAVSVNKHP